MTLYKNSFISKFYCKYFDVHQDCQTTNGCNWMWGFIFAIISLPFSWASLFMDFYGVVGGASKIFIRTIFGFIIQLILLAFISITVTNPIGVAEICGIITGICVVVIGFIYLIVLYSEWKDKERSAPNIIGEAYKSFKEKYCPKIEWK